MYGPKTSAAFNTATVRDTNPLQERERNDQKTELTTSKPEEKNVNQIVTEQPLNPLMMIQIL